jgi:hypothetical protein
MKTVKIIFSLMIALSVGFSCDSSTYDEVSGEVSNPMYVSNIKPIIANNCLSCHSAAGAQYPTMETYMQVREATENGAVICRIDDQSCGAVMPQSGRMPQATINIIKKWAANGYPEN